MTPLPFKSQDYCDCTLVEALDRIARRAGVVDGCFNSFTGERPSPERPWVFLDSGRFAHNRHERSELDEFLDRGPVGALLNEDERRSRLASAKRVVGSMMAFEEAIRPLFVALEDGLLVLEGFEKTGKRAAAIMTRIDKARWQPPLAWTVARREQGALVELFSDLSEEPEISFVGCRLALGDGLKKPRAADKSKNAASSRKGAPERYGWKAVYKEWFAHFDYYGVPGEIEPGSQKKALDVAEEWISKRDPYAKAIGKVPDKFLLQKNLKKAIAEYTARQNANICKEPPGGQ